MASATPTKKVQAAGASGALATLIVFVLEECGVDLTPEVGAALATVLAFVGGYIKGG